MLDVPIAGSFRDPAGVVFRRNGVVHRHVRPSGFAAYRRLMSSGLYAALVGERLLVPHEDLGPEPGSGESATVLRPQQIPMISYPYEWSLSQLRDAALVTLRAHALALRYGMVLKDASAFNVQFVGCEPLLIDTLSFAPYEGGPWLAYRQFCQHFYGPLVLGASRDARLVGISRQFIDGVPLTLVSRLLPRLSYLRPGPLLHLHLHARAETAWSKADGRPGHATSASGFAPASTTSPTPSRLEALAQSLERGVNAITWSTRSAWSNYYAARESYADAAFAHKDRVVADWLSRAAPSTVWDLGANTGHFSRLAAAAGARTVALDADAACVDVLYRDLRQDATATGVLPLVMDLANPSPAIGWANAERMTLAERGPADLIMALAVAHHLAIGNNVPLLALAAYLASLGRRAIIEFVPKADPMVQGLLRSRADVFDDYTEVGFEQAIERYFTIDERVTLTPSTRTLYRLTTR